MYLIFLLLLKVILSKYNRTKALHYVYKYYKNPNHKCGFGRWQCTPYGYFGNTHCKYSRSDDDSSNFVSQVLIESGHPKIVGDKCKGIPCGVEINANNLAYCLKNNFKWKSECKKNLPPPKYIREGDIVIYYKDGCYEGKASAYVVTVKGSNAKVSGHTPECKDSAYIKFAKEKSFIEWLHYDD